MTYPEWIAGSVTLLVAVLVSIAVDPAVGFAAGLVAFPLVTRIAGALDVRPARLARGRAGALDA